MTLLDQMLPTPRLVEVDRAELAAPPAHVWELLRHGDLARSPLVRALFALRTLPERLRGHASNASFRLDDLVSSSDRPGFRILAETPPQEVAVGAIGKVWLPEIPFVHVDDVQAFADFAAAGFVKVAWALRVNPRGERDSSIEVEVRVDATDDDSWRKFERYFRAIGPGSHFIRRAVIASLARELGTPEGVENERTLPGDDLLPDAAAQVTDGITIAAPPAQIWPWLLQLGCGRAGFYAIDILDNGGIRSARELHPDLTQLVVGQVLPATPDGDDGFEVLRIEAPHCLALGGLYDPEQGKQLLFAAPRPAEFWQVTWVFVLEPLDARTTRLHVRARAAFSRDRRLHAAVIRPVHHFMQAAMLKHLQQRVEGRLPRDDARDVAEGMAGAGLMLVALATPFLRHQRRHWGLDERTAAREYPGDELVAEPRWSWTHGIEIEAPAARVWPWVAQMGADRAGFYSYQWLENLVGCDLRNAETLHPEWQAKVGDSLVLHPDPKAPRLRITAVEPGHHLVAYGAPDEAAQAAGRPWAAASWLFFLEALSDDRCRLISRYRVACSEDLATRAAYGPLLLEPIGYAMDRRMLLGVKARAERVVATPER